MEEKAKDENKHKWDAKQEERERKELDIKGRGFQWIPGIIVWIKSLVYSVWSSTTENKNVSCLLALQPHITHKGLMLLIICGRDHWL